LRASDLDPDPEGGLAVATNVCSCQRFADAGPSPDIAFGKQLLLRARQNCLHYKFRFVGSAELLAKFSGYGPPAVCQPRAVKAGAAVCELDLGRAGYFPAKFDAPRPSCGPNRAFDTYCGSLAV
jgi:hypothetical protein